MKEEGRGEKGQARQNEEDDRWHKTKPGWHKVNVDAGWSEGVGLGLGAVCRDEIGAVMWGIVWQERAQRDTAMLEAKAVLMGSKEARRAGLSHIIIESDCLTVVEDLKKKKRGRGDIGLVYDDIFDLCLHFAEVEFVFSRRSCNKVAHELVHVRPWEAGSRFWPGDLPPYINDVAASDIGDLI
ncbi:uncharacterized protein LOC141640881 [Silene latifolia]|uniref:uncharacterized protein LOC141640881 n=1 Tax=Silene latifolia TaxID=37657 RepID=UPI003D78A87C